MILILRVYRDDALKTNRPRVNSLALTRYHVLFEFFMNRQSWHGWHQKNQHRVVADPGFGQGGRPRIFPEILQT